MCVVLAFIDITFLRDLKLLIISASHSIIDVFLSFAWFYGWLMN